MWPFAHQDFETALLILVENEKHLVAIEQCKERIYCNFSLKRQKSYYYHCKSVPSMVNFIRVLLNFRKIEV